MREKSEQIKRYLAINSIKNFGMTFNKESVSIDTSLKELDSKIKFELEQIMGAKEVVLSEKNDKFNQIIIIL